ncbi:transaldolase family protein [Geosporobacter ferrireducens]|uniref:Fructose-6-phosphate aldolase n=1 Tax=Geosporobacter ferrireducens TaxID=1424294 RepID=A0A1D8GDA9_9FIRM|nr:transaldolase family protein [Geosporobacter ferrireducens]AOT68884.1 hypothetical protein Gferi_04525 [Geosporobacter ferrireducens]MTI54882.1 fructose-6-phosphate aldolase [Geosporobacter ferrireducens]
MQYLLDTADVQAIQRAYDLYPVCGVTTNPTIIAKENRPFFEILRDIRNIIGNASMLHVQTLGKTAAEIVKEGEYLHEIVAGNIYVKIPVTAEGIKAIKILTSKEIQVTATAILTAQQALMAAVAGASYVAPYVNRIDNIAGDGVGVVAEIVELFNTYKLETKVLAASFKNIQQIHGVALAGAHSVTINGELMDGLLQHPLTDWSIDRFSCDWEGVYGKNKLVSDL